MAKIYYELDVGYCGCGDEGVIDVGDMPEKSYDDLVNEMALEWANQWVGDERLMSEEEWKEDEESFWGNVGGTWEPYDPEKHDGYEIEKL